MPGRSFRPNPRVEAEVFRTIRPKKIRKDIFQKEFRAGLRLVVEGMYKDFKKTTRTWDREVKFKKIVRVTKQPLRVAVTTNNKIYFFVCMGTKSHTIEPGKKGFLAFQPVLQTKTTPRLISSRKGKKSKKWVYTKKPVKVKGIKPRKFHIVIRERWRPKVKKEMARRLKRAAKLSGHAVR